MITQCSIGQKIDKYLAINIYQNNMLVLTQMNTNCGPVFPMSIDIISKICTDTFTSPIKVIKNDTVTNYIDQCKKDLSTLIAQYNKLDYQYGKFSSYDESKHRFIDIVDSQTFGTSKVNILHRSGELLSVSGDRSVINTGADIALDSDIVSDIDSDINICATTQNQTVHKSNLTGARYSIGGKIWLATQQPLGLDDMRQTTTDDFLAEGFTGSNDCFMVLNLNNSSNSRNYLTDKSNKFDLSQLHSVSVGSIRVDLFRVVTKVPNMVVSKVPNSVTAPDPITKLIPDTQTATQSMSRTMIVIHYTGWPDYGIPSDPTEFCKMFGLVQNLMLLTNLCIIHCRGGIGRTGTFITIVKCYQVLNKSICPDIVKIIKELRHVRPGMVQTVDQFIFIVRCLECLFN